MTKSNKSFWLGLGFAAGLMLEASRQFRQRRMRAAWNEALRSEPFRTALVTGASSGIGEAFAWGLAERGYDLVLVARREERLQDLALTLEQQFNVRVQVLAADLSKDTGIAGVEAHITSIGHLDLLVNNAGYDVFGDFAEIPYHKYDGLIRCMVIATTRLMRTALPLMLRSGHGGIINVSSIGAYIPKAKDSIYIASKAFVSSLSESVARELHGSGVRIQALCPGFTHTEFHDDPQFTEYQIKERVPQWMWMTSEEVAERSLEALECGEVVHIPGWRNRLIVAGARSGLTDFLLGIFRKFMMDEEKRPTPE